MQKISENGTLFNFLYANFMSSSLELYIILVHLTMVYKLSFPVMFDLIA